MHMRFRKKSDAKRVQPSQHPPAATQSEEEHPADFLNLQLPPVGDSFRTSLILPDLSRRFSLLRTPAGEPVTVDDLRSKFAQHRAKGSQNTITEEEEDMLLDTLNRLRGKPTGASSPERSQESINGNDGGLNEDDSVKANKAPSGATSSPSSGRSAKRYSNNLFGSGRLRDYSYLRTVATSRTSTSDSLASKTSSVTPSETSSSTPKGNPASLSERPTTPTRTSMDEPSISGSSVNDEGSGRSTGSPYLEQTQAFSAAEYRLQRSLSPAVLKRASLALESAIKEMEDEMEEEIVMPRSTPIPRTHDNHHATIPQRQASDTSTRSAVSSIVVEAGMAISSDKPVDPSDIHAQRGPSPVPLNATPGYIPGMPRPMTPRDFEFFADERSHSTTPRATSPMHHSFAMMESATASVSISKTLRNNSTASSLARQSPRPTTPLFLQRSAYSATSMNGRHTPVDDRNRYPQHSNNSGDSSYEADQSLSSSIPTGRRRPASPLSSNSPFQPIPHGSPNSQGYSISRPTTPSKVIWNVNPDASPGQLGDVSGSPGSGHSRDNSWTSDGGASDAELQNIIAAASRGSDIFGRIGMANGGNGGTIQGRQRSGSQSNGHTYGAHGLNSSGSYSSADDSTSFASNRGYSNGRPISPLNESTSSQKSFSEAASRSTDHYSQSQSRSHRSSTPTQTAPRSPGSATFGNFHQRPSSRATKRTSGQNLFKGGSSGFTIPPLALNSRANLSSDSLHSTGSSFHSWDDNNDKLLDIFNDDGPQPAWHDLSSPSSERSGPWGPEKGDDSSTDDDWEPEEIIRSYAGLKKVDFAAIQEKLCTTARATELRSSALRKRRPSTSQSNYSYKEPRVASPPPPASPVAHTFNRDQQQTKPSSDLSSSLSAPSIAHSISGSSIDSGARRNLTQMLFGEADDDKADTSATLTAVPLDGEANISTSSDLPNSSVHPENHITELLEKAMGRSPDTQPAVEPPAAPSTHTLNRSLSTGRVPQTPQDQNALAREVEEKVHAATVALRKQATDDGHANHGAAPRKRIDPSKISKPTLVSASTSVDTIPLKTPSLTASTGSGGFGSRFRKLRGSIRGKPTTIDENASVNSDTKSNSPGNQTATYDADKLKAASGPSSSGLTDAGRYKVAVPSPPASAGPGLKGFMARFRAKRMTELPQSSSSASSQGSPQIPTAPFSPMSPSHKLFPISSPTPTTSHFTSAQLQVGHAGQGSRPTPPHNAQTQITEANSPTPQRTEIAKDPKPEEGGNDVDAFEQLFAAANKIGIDPTALNALLVRSGSISSSNMLSRTASTSHSGSSQGNAHAAPGGDSRLAVPPIQQPNLSSSTDSDYTATPANYATSSGSSPYGEGVAGGAERGVERRPSMKTPEPQRRPRKDDDPSNPVVRRTIVFPDRSKLPMVMSNTDQNLSRRTSKKSRRASTQSVSNRSVHDRVPTPPPSKVPAAKRFSHDGSPPVPHLPESFGGQAENLLAVHPGNNGKAHSGAYDSLYEYYGDSRAPSVMVDPYSHSHRGTMFQNYDGVTPVEFVELADGNVLWHFIEKLRSDDDASLYTGRNSVASEYSTHTDEDGLQGAQGLVKGHARSGSKSSNTSFVSHKKGKPRPETKVMHSPPEEISAIIEKLSRGMDAGVFNFHIPNQSGAGSESASGSGSRSTGNFPTHSNTSSMSANPEIHWTMKEIDHLLTAMSPTRTS